MRLQVIILWKRRFLRRVFFFPLTTFLNILKIYLLVSLFRILIWALCLGVEQVVKEILTHKLIPRSWEERILIRYKHSFLLTISTQIDKNYLGFWVKSLWWKGLWCILLKSIEEKRAILFWSIYEILGELWLDWVEPVYWPLGLSFTPLKKYVLVNC